LCIIGKCKHAGSFNVKEGRAGGRAQKEERDQTSNLYAGILGVMSW